MKKQYFLKQRVLPVMTAAAIAMTVGSPMNVLAEETETLEVSGASGPTEYGLDVAEQIAEEGIVLLENEDKTLPLAEGTKVNLFGATQCSPFYGGGGSGSVTASNIVDLYQSLEDAGIEINADLKEAYQNWWNNGGSELSYKPEGDSGLDGYSTSNVANPEMELTDEMLAAAKAYSDTALVIIGRSGSEGADLGEADMSLYEDERTMISQLTDNFENVIILYNVCAPLCENFDFLTEEQMEHLKASMIIWAPGQQGMEAVGKVLNGEVNPSGRLTDTVAVDIENYPSTVNFGDCLDPATVDTAEEDSGVEAYFVEYEEDIYVGYRYFETDAFDAKEEVLYPFGYGLSYTTFDLSTDSIEAESSGDATTDTVTITVTVTNTGDYAGKEVVQVYYKAPASDKEIEKADRELIAFAKTDELEPGESQTLTLNFDASEMSSWYYDEGCYIMEKGDYEFYIGTDVRQAQLADTSYSLAEDQLIERDPVTNAEYMNLFENASHKEGVDGLGVDGSMTLLSIYDTENTMPDYEYTAESKFSGGFGTSGENQAHTTEGEDIVTEDWWQYVGICGSYITMEQQGVTEKAAIQLEDVYYGDAAMSDFLAQMTDSELVAMQLGGGFGSIGFERLGIPATTAQDGPASVKASRRSEGLEDGTAFPIETMLACTWNISLAEEMGTAAALEAPNEDDISSWYAPAANIHRNPMGGRNFEYYSEDPLLSGMMMSYVTIGAQSNGLTVTLKHFAVNDQETNREGIHTYVSEQAMREIYLKPFEMAVKAGAYGIMTGFNRIGDEWCGSNSALLTDLLRTEWGFEGYVLSDSWQIGYMNAVESAYAGQDTMLLARETITEEKAEHGRLDWSNALTENHDEARQVLETCIEHILNYVMQTRTFAEVIGTDENVGSSVSEETIATLPFRIVE